MKEQPHRLGPDVRHFGGTAINRQRPLKIKLNGLTLSCFEGDTVLSALLAAGYDTVGQREGQPVALTLRHAPPVVPLAHARDSQRALPMERTPVTQGADYLTVGVGRMTRLKARLQKLRRSRSLGLDLDNPLTMQRPWLSGPAEPDPAADLIVVGGGVSGMTAALAAAKAGLQVTLIEANLHLGGNAGLFGTQDGEETPEQCIGRLVAAIGQSDAITVLTGTEAIAARPGAVRVHNVAIVNRAPASRVLDLSAPHIVIATGVLERLPIFAGNQLPGIATTLEAYSLALHFGIWPGKTALFATVTNVPYRLAMLASDAGVNVLRIIDARPSPQSRFIEFAKAYGITMAAGTIPGGGQQAKKGCQISLTPQLSFRGLAQAEQPLLADRLVMCGGWQPDLSLWHMAGGESRWNPSANRLESTGAGPQGVTLTGSAAGYISRHACLQSGQDAIAHLLDHPRRAVEERLIDPIYETQDDPTPVAAGTVSGGAPAFLDHGHSFIERPEHKISRWPAWLPFVPRPRAWSLADMPHPLAIADIAAGTQLGAIPAESAGIVAQERVALIPIAATQAAATDPPSALANTLPRYLTGRFGSDGAQLLIAPLEKRRLEVGALIFPDADETDPSKSIGVVARIGNSGAMALLAALAGQPGLLLFVREDNRAIAVRLIGAYGPGLDLDAALGSGAGAS